MFHLRNPCDDGSRAYARNANGIPTVWAQIGTLGGTLHCVAYRCNNHRRRSGNTWAFQFACRRDLVVWLARLVALFQLKLRQRLILSVLDVHGRRLRPIIWENDYETKNYPFGRQSNWNGKCGFGERGKSLPASAGLPVRLDSLPEKETENFQLHLRNYSDKRNLKPLHPRCGHALCRRETL